MELFYIGLIFIVSTFVQGFTSFGFSLVAIPLLALFWGAKLIVIVTMTYSFVINSIIIRKYYRDAKLNKILPLLITAIIFTFIGISYLHVVNDFMLKIMIAVLLIVVGIINNLGVRFELKKPERFYIPVGMISGILNGISGISGPPVLVFLSNINLSKSEFKATLSSYFFTLNIVAMAIYTYKGFYTVETMKLIATYVPYVIGGTAMGVYMSTKVSEVFFKRVVNIFIPIMGINMIVKIIFN